MIGIAIFAREGGKEGEGERGSELIKGFQSEKSKGTIERADVTTAAQWGWPGMRMSWLAAAYAVRTLGLKAMSPQARN